MFSEVFRCFRYDRDSGKIFWKEKPRPKFSSGVTIGKEVGIIESTGYRRTTLHQVRYHTHVLVWIFEHGYMPTCIDHIDGNPLNNHISNLRAVSRRENQSNMKKHRQGHVVGTSFNKCQKKNPWASRIYVNGKSVFLGWHPTQEQAGAAYQAFLTELL